MSGVLATMLLAVGFDAIAPWPFKLLIDDVLAPNPIVIDAGITLIDRIFASRYLICFFVALLYFWRNFCCRRGVCAFAKSRASTVVLTVSDIVGAAVYHEMQ